MSFSDVYMSSFFCFQIQDKIWQWNRVAILLWTNWEQCKIQGRYVNHFYAPNWGSLCSLWCPSWPCLWWWATTYRQKILYKQVRKLPFLLLRSFDKLRSMLYLTRSSLNTECLILLAVLLLNWSRSSSSMNWETYVEHAKSSFLSVLLNKTIYYVHFGVNISLLAGHVNSRKVNTIFLYFAW